MVGRGRADSGNSQSREAAVVCGISLPEPNCKLLHWSPMIQEFCVCYKAQYGRIWFSMNQHHVLWRTDTLRTLFSNLVLAV